ncbi:MAG: T9SS type A sorting domain-containing protein [Bacteroidia bacterium]|jgi:hypothetical protein|nr:T9SS type A sorting domain-containing protein [Bacteroidia bacterium]
MKPTRKYLLPISIFLSCISPKLFSQAPANFNFELSSPGQYTTANAVPGWTVESAVNSMSFGGIGCVPNPSIIWTQGSPEFSILATPIINVPFLGVLPNSPFGGNNVARLNNTSSPTAQITRISSQFQVTSILNLLQFAFAGSWDGSHLCCESASFRIEFYNCTNSLTPIPALTLSLTPGSGQCIGVAGYSLTGQISWTNWQQININLSSYMGQCIKMVVTVSDCAYAGHHGSAFFDVNLTSQLAGWYSGSIVPIAAGTPVNFCSGSNQAILTAPLGYQTYQWVAPGGFYIPPPLGTSPTFSFTNPIPGITYTCIVTNNGITTVFPFTINPSQVSIVGLGTSNTCLGGSSGSASVVANGSGSGYTYTWLNSNSVTVSTSSVASGLSPGVYSVIVSSNTGSACGIASSTIAIGSQSNNVLQTFIKPYCGPEAYFCAGAGSNFQWYNGTVAIAAPLGTAQCFTLSNPTNGGFVHLKYASAQGCQDSVKFILGSSAPGNISILSSTYACQGTANGSVVVNLNPAPGAQIGQNTFSVFSTGTLNPVYSASLAAGFQTSFGLVNLHASTYSIIAFDGSCKNTNTFVIVNFPNNYTLSANNTTLCSGHMTAAGVTFTSPPSPGQYTYSWSPSNLLAGSNQQSTIILQNTPSPGLLNTVVFTVVVTPSLINCPLSKTMAITWANPITPSISPIPTLCSNSLTFAINAIPMGGVFGNISNQVINSSSGILTPSLASIGLNSFSYNNSVGPCQAVTNASFFIGGPNVSLFGSTQICSGQSGTLFATGANTYTWSNGSNSNSISVSPTINTVYSVTGSHSLDVCTSTKTILVQSINPPNIQISGNSSVCALQSTTLTASGANSYTWSTGSTSPSILITPVLSSIITVTGSSTPTNCINQQTVLLQVIPGPPLQISGPTLVCEGQAFSLMASGANSYTWFASTSTWTNTNNGSTLTLAQAGTNTYSLNAISSMSLCNSYTTITVYTMPCLGLDDNPEFSSLFKIYPNPGSGLFLIESAEETEIEVFNALGQLVLQKTILAGKQSIDLSEQAAGLYFMNCKTNGISRVVRLVKQD